MTIRVLIADDHKILRQGLITLLQGESDIEVVGEADDGYKTMELIKESQPDVVIMDVAMPNLNGVEVTRQVVAAFPGIRIIALSMHADRRFVVGMLAAGAWGYLLKDSAFEELALSIRSVMDYRVYLSPGIAGVVVKDYMDRLMASGSLDAAALTSRETEVLQLLAEGKTTADIASLLEISVKTVETHRKQIMDKLNLHSVAELTKYAIREGLTSLDS